MHMPVEPDNLNPVISNDAAQSEVNAFIFESLLTRDLDTLQLKPQLAERWSVDGMQYTFFLRRDVLWSDGVPFTAQDVLFSFRTIMSPDVASAPLKVYYSQITSVTAPDAHTVVFRMKERHFKSLEICSSMPILPRHIYGTGDFNRHPANRSPVGMGPYRFRSWDSGRRIELEANPRYYGRKPGFERIVFRVIPEPNVALQLLKKGELDVMELRPIQWVRQTNSSVFNSRFRKIRYYYPNYSYIAWNNARPHLSSPRTRRALTMLINRRELGEKLFFGLNRETTGPAYPFSADYDASLQPLPFDPQAAAALLAADGWKDSDGDGILDRNGKKLSIEFMYPSASKFGNRLATIMKEDFTRRGIDVRIAMLEWGAFLKRVSERNFDSYMMAWNTGIDADHYQIWHSSQTKDGSNYISYRNTQADSLIERARVELNAEKRNALNRSVHRLVYEDQPYTFLYCNPRLIVVSRRIQDVREHVLGLDYLEWRH